MARFLSLNVNGLRDVNKRMSLLQWLSQLNLDFVCFQETHVVSHSECLSWFSSYGFLTVVSPGSPHSCGSVILYRSKYHLVKTWSDSSGRFVMAEFQHHDVSFRLACIYAPNRNPERNDFFAYCESIVDPSDEFVRACVSPARSDVFIERSLISLHFPNFPRYF